jgi:DNA-binding transcriptional LysR family regulator
MDLRRLEVFAKVAELGSFSRAAQALSLTQPTVSEHVRALEDELGVQLLDRLGRGAAPTRAGALLLGYAQRMLTLAREARQAIDQFQGRLSGELLVGGSTIPGGYVLPTLIGQFKAKQAEISITLLIGDSREVSRWVDEGRVELGIVGAKPAQRSLDARALMSDELMVVVGAEHPWATRDTVSLAELAAEPMVLRERGSGSREALEHALETAGSSLSAHRIVGEMGSTQAIKQAVRAGVGVSLISRRAIEDELRAGHLAALTIPGVAVGRAFYLVTHRERTRSPLAVTFLTFLESHFPAGGS